MFRQTVRDFCVNQQFRRDYWVKGARKLSALEHAMKQKDTHFVCRLCQTEQVVAGEQRWHQ